MYEKIKKVDWLTVINDRLVAHVINDDSSTYTLLADIKGIELNISSDKYYNDKVPIVLSTAKFELACKMDNEGKLFTLVSENAPPKSLTKIEIEKILGYTIKIVP